MSELWRRKTYYAGRVLIETEHVLSSTSKDSLVCITGPQFEMLRNLTQYLKRRSTFVSEYHDSYYDAPTTAQWDDIQAIVADLEETLMGCSELTTALELIAAQLACICQAFQGTLAQTQPLDPGYTDQEYYDEYISAVEAGEGSPPAPFGDWDEWATYVCKGAQKLVDDAAAACLAMGTTLTTGILITFSVINLALLATVIAAPVSIVIQIVTTLVAIGVNFAYTDVVDWLLDNKEALVCSIYSAETAVAGYSAVQAAIANLWDAGPGIQIVQALFNREVVSSVYDGTMRDDTLWIGDYTDAFCVPCGEYPEGYTWTWVWPPCPRAEFIDGGICWSGMHCHAGNIEVSHQQVIISLGSVNRIDFTVLYKSHYASGYTVGHITIHRWDTETLEWVDSENCTCTTSQAAGVQNETTHQTNFSARDGGLWRVTIRGQVPQEEVEPYPFMVQSLEVTFSLV